MARPWKDLASQVEDIVADAMERVKDLVKDSLNRELGDLIGGGALPAGRKKGAGAGRPAKGGKKAKAGKGKPGRKPTLTPERVQALAALVAKQGEVVPKAARKALKLNAPQMQTTAREAVKQGLIKVKGAGRGTRYVKA
ncbi:MAG: hypothetical protein AB2A00_37850 [Myxococcota bacterium]